MGYIAKGSITLDTVNDAYTVSLSKQSCVIHADFDGSNPKLSEAQTTVTVLRGDKVMAFDCVSLTDGGTIGFTIENTNRISYRIALTSIPKDSLEGTLQFRITTDDGYTTTIQFSYTVVRESTMLDWIKDWEGSKTKIGGTYIMTPKIFIGRKDEYAEYGEGGANAKDSIMSVPGLTGVYIGPDTESTGLYGYLNSEEIFHLNGTGGMIGGWTIDSYGIQSKNGRLQILSNGEIRAINEEGDSIWRITENGEASFAMDNVRFFANGDAEFKGKITSKEGQIGGWTIDEGRLYNVPIGISASGKYIAIANVESLPTNSEWGENHFGWMRGYGGVALYYSSRNNFGFIAYGTGGDNMVFSAGSTNCIAGWNFDTEAIWSGTKNNTTSGYSADGITIGSNGLRGIKWYIDSNGDVSFMNGKITFSAADNGGEIVGWKLNERRLSTNKVALTSDDTSVGLYMSAAANANFNSLASSSLEDFIDSWGGIYLKVKTDSADFAAYDSEGIRLFKIKSGGTSYIAGWCFDGALLWTGTQATSGFTTSGSISLGPTGLRGYKWRFENDGSGSLAGGNISWDASGKVTFSSAVSLSWTKGIDEAKAAASSASSAAATAQSTADGANTKYTNMLGTYLTHIGSDGIYTGTLTADQINGLSCTFKQGSIGGWTINSDHITKNDIYLGSNGDIYCSYNSIEYWKIDNLGKATFAQGQVAFNKDGSGSLAGGNISWNAYGNLVFTTQASYTSGSNDMNTGFGAVLKISASTGIIESTAKNAPSYSTATSYLSSNGIFSNIAGINGMPSSSGYTHRGAIVGLGFANVSKSTWAMDANETIVTGVYGRASNSGTAPAYGGFFYSLFAGGLVLGRKCVSGTSDSTVYLSDSHTLVIGYTSATATVYLPSNPKEGQIVVFKQWWTGKMRITPYTGQSLYDDSTENDYYDCTEGQTVIAVFSIGYITSGNTTTKKEAWLVGRYKF